MSRQVAGFTPARAKAINGAVAFLERNGYNTNRGRRRGYRQPVDDALDLEFRVNGCQTLQYRVNGGEWVTIAILRLRLEGSNLQLSLDPSTNPTYCTWETTTECPE